MLEKIEIIKAGGDTSSVDLISEFEVQVNDIARRYVLLTANEIDQNGLIKLLATEIKDKKLVRIESEDDWTVVKNVMRSIISGSAGDFAYINTSNVKSYNVSDDYARIIAVQDAAKQALIKDYSDKKPQEAEPAEVAPAAPEVKEDPNANIYPQEKVDTPIGSEVVAGIAEVKPDAPAPEPVKAPVEEKPEPQDIAKANESAAPAVNPPQPAPAAVVVPEVPVVETPAVAETPVVAPAASSETAPIASGSDNASEELVKDIIMAVNKYMSAGNSAPVATQDLKDTIARIQADLNKVSEAVK